MENVERPNIIAAIAEARTHGDLSENALTIADTLFGKSGRFRSFRMDISLKNKMSNL